MAAPDIAGTRRSVASAGVAAWRSAAVAPSEDCGGAAALPSPLAGTALPSTAAAAAVLTD